MQHESGCLGQSGNHGIQLQHIILHLFCDGMQHESGRSGQSGDHGIQLQHLIQYLFLMACSMNKVIYDRVGNMVFSFSIVFCICL